MGRRGYRFIGAIQLGREAAGPSSVRAWLIGQRERVALKAGETVLGRHAPDVVELPSPTVSRRHARITVGDETLIEDPGARRHIRGGATGQPSCHAD
jgi:pSer/pThr/pTyr-binding forkhead associated (FHA) protein